MGLGSVHEQHEHSDGPNQLNHSHPSNQKTKTNPSTLRTTRPIHQTKITHPLRGSQRTKNKTMKMGKKELGKWNHFGDIHAMGKSVHQGWFGTLTLSKWMNAGLVRTVRFWEDSVEISGGKIREWNMGEIIATEKGLEIL